VNTFAQELKELIEKHRDMPGTVLADLVDDLEDAVEKLVTEMDAS
jgi:quinol monooxygenase YgiN